MNEASDVVALPGGGLLVAGDTSATLKVVGADGKVTKLKLDEGVSSHKPSQFEGVAYDPVRHHLILSREESRELIRYEWDPASGKAPKFQKKFSYDSALDGPRNKGIEGLTYLPKGNSFTGKAQLLGVREGKPRSLLVFGDGGGGGKPKAVKLEDQVRSVCRDFSAVAVDPKTGNLFISSDESSTVAQIELVDKGDHVVGRLVQSFALRGNDGKPLARIEGLTTNERGDLFVLTENDGVIRQLKRVN